MKKLLVISLFLFSVFSFGANKVLKVAATPVPAAEILNLVKDDLKKQGIDLKIIELTDYVTPNILLADKQIDANFFQHVPYLESFAKEKNLKLTYLPPIYIVPMGLYSLKVKKLEDFKSGATIAIPNDPTNAGRALILLHNNGIVKLKDPKNLGSTERDIIENPKKLKIKLMEAAQLPRILQDVDGAVINGNYALEAKLNPLKDALIIEGKDSPYSNVVAIRVGDEKRDEILKLNDALRSEKIRKYLLEKYKGGVVSVVEAKK
ncbi:MAG: MetQ/NlpA family ABC transporter substrate-binding protein [Fusobacteriaceae bacterium]